MAVVAEKKSIYSFGKRILRDPKVLDWAETWPARIMEIFNAFLEYIYKQKEMLVKALFIYSFLYEGRMMKQLATHIPHVKRLEKL